MYRRRGKIPHSPSFRSIRLYLGGKNEQLLDYLPQMIDSAIQRVSFVASPTNLDADEWEGISRGWIELFKQEAHLILLIPHYLCKDADRIRDLYPGSEVRGHAQKRR